MVGPTGPPIGDDRRLPHLKNRLPLPRLPLWSPLRLSRSKSLRLLLTGLRVIPRDSGRRWLPPSFLASLACRRFSAEVVLLQSGLPIALHPIRVLRHGPSPAPLPRAAHLPGSRPRRILSGRSKQGGPHTQQL